MNPFRNLSRGVSAVLVMMLTLCCLNTPAYAGIVGTQVAIEHQQVALDRAQLLAMLDRSDLRDELVAYGVDPNEARERIAALSDTEVQSLAGKVGELPNGGDTLVGAVVLIFLVLLFTDLMGWTDVYPFVKKTAR